MAHVLLADDDAATRDLVRRALTGDDVEEALELALGTAQPFDIVVTDVQMPVIDGISLAEQLLARTPALRVILMSGLQSEMARANRLKGANVRFLMKPFSLDAIRTEIRVALR